MIDVIERCGVFIQLQNEKYLWIAMPFWNTGRPLVVTSPARSIEAIIVLNNCQEGCLPLTAMLALDVRYPLDRIYKINGAQYHDWAPGVSEMEKLNQLIRTHPLPLECDFGAVHVRRREGDNFLTLDFPRPEDGGRVRALVGTGIAYERTDNEGLDLLTLIGNFDPEKLEKTMQKILLEVVAGPLNGDFNKVRILLWRDAIRCNPPAYTQALSILGFDVHAIGKPEWESEAGGDIIRPK
jgi:hypothetical protein